MSGTERLDLHDEHRPLARRLCALLVGRGLLRPDRRPVIAIAGESGSGKSITALALARELDASGVHSLVLHQDDYFHRPPRANHEARMRDLASVGPHEVNLALLAEHVADFRGRREGVAGPAVDHETDRFRSRALDFTAVDALLVEGTYVLRLPDADLRIFLAATHAETAERRRRRNRDPEDPVVDRALAIEHEIIAAQRSTADVVIGADFEVDAPPA